MKKEKKEKKTKKLIALFLCWGVVAATTAIAIPFLIVQKNNEENHLAAKENNYKVQMSFEPISPSEAHLNVDDLEPFINKWMVLEYSQVNDAASKDNDSNDLKPLKTHRFLVTNEEMLLRINNLNAGVNYSFRLLLDSNKQEVGVKTSSTVLDNQFYTFSKAQLSAHSGANSISVVSSVLNSKFKNNIMVFKYRELGSNEPLKAVDTVTGDINLNSSTNINEGDFTLSAQIDDLEKGKAYIIHLEIDGQASFFADPIIVWTKGGVPKTAVSKTYSHSVEGVLGGIEDFVVKKDPNTSFLIKYWKDTETIDQAQSVALSLGEDAEISYQIKGLDSDTAYNYKLYRVDATDNQSYELGDTGQFRTSIAPRVVNKANTYNDLNLPIWRSSQRAAIFFENFTSSVDSSTINPTQLEVVLIKKPENDQEIDWKLSENKFNLQSSGSQHYVELNDIPEIGTKYLVQLFNKKDIKLENPYLDRHLEFLTPSKFNANVEEVVGGKAKISLNGINNVVSNELQLIYWEKGNESATKKDKKISWEGEVADLEVILDDLGKDKTYEFMVVPAISNLTSDADSLLIQGKLEFVNPGFLESKSYSISDNEVKLVLAGVNYVSRLKDINLKLQWRAKQESSTDWENATSANSLDFTIPSSHSGDEYTVDLPLTLFANNDKTIFYNSQFEWRVVKESEASNPKRNEIEAGSVEFSLNKNAYEYVSEAANPFGYFDNSDEWIKWKQLNLDELLVWKKGAAKNTIVNISGARLSTRKQWSDFLEYLAYNSESKEKFKKIFLNALATLSPSPSTMNNRSKILPFDPGNFTDSNTDPNSEWYTTGIEGAGLGGWSSSTANAEDAPIKPADFMDLTNSKFKNFASVSTALDYRLQLTKEKWGISKDNIFATNLGKRTKGETYASEITSAKRLKSLYKLQLNNVFGNEYNVEIAENTDSETNIFANDKEGILFFKVKASKKTDSTSHLYLWQYIDGFKKLDVSANQPSENFAITRRFDSLDTALVISEMYKAASTKEAKNAIVLKHFDIKVNSPLFDYEIVNLEFDNSNINQLKITLKITSKDIKTATLYNLTSTESLGATETNHQFTIELPRVISTIEETNLNPMNAASVTTKQTGAITNPTAINDTQFRAAVLVNIPYYELNAIFRDALKSKEILSDDTKYNALAAKIQTLLKTDMIMNTDDMVSKYAYLRAGLNELFSAISGGVMKGSYGLETGSDNQPFQFWISAIPLSANTDEARLDMAKSFIDKYGQLEPVTEETAIKRTA